MKKMKKAIAVILSLAMVLGMSLTAFAGEVSQNTPPKSGDTTTAKISNVEAGATVTAYQIVEADYNAYGLKGYKRVSNVTEAMLSNPVKPTATEITGIANSIAAGSLSLTSASFSTTGTEGLVEYTATLAPGYWVVIIKGSDIQEVYNPLLVGVYYSIGGSNNTLSQGTWDEKTETIKPNEPVDANTNWNLSTEGAYAKSSKPTLDKKITGSVREDGTTDRPLDSHENSSGNDVAIGDTVKFEIDTVIPSYSGSYTATGVRVEIEDSLSEGLKLNSVPVVKVGNTVIESKDYAKIEDSSVDISSKDIFGENGLGKDKAYVYQSGDNGFKIAFNPTYALAHQGADVVVTYNAELTADAGLNLDANTNDAKLTYTNDPSNRNEIDEITDRTYTYTFGIDADLFGNNEYKTGELFKVDENTTSYTEASTGKIVSNPLPNAEFTLTKTDAAGKVIEGEQAWSKTAISGEDGRISFEGLDAGYYILKETKAPNGYTLNDDTHKVVITASYEKDGRLKEYSIAIDDKATDGSNVTNTSKYTPSYTNEGEAIVDIDTTVKVEASVAIKNTRLSNLPSTGGIGTTIFTIGGCAIMIIAAALFFASRRRAVK